MNEITITVGEKLFTFESFDDWVNNARNRFKSFDADSVIAVDAKGRICFIGREFMRARDDEAFPVIVYAKTF